MSQRQRLGQYELVDLLAQGEILSVYSGYDTKRGRTVILKSVLPQLQDDTELTARFCRRAEQLLLLSHSHIVPALEAGFERGALYLVSDVPDGESLERRLLSQGAVEIDDVISIFSQVAEALDYAHQHGIFHHDLRPAHIYLRDKAASLTDFSLLEAIGATPTFLAPEQLDETSAEVADGRTDSYALGAIIYQTLAGKPPFEGAAEDVATAHLTQRPLPPRVHNPDLFPAVDAILLKALAKQPKRRFQSAGELMDALEEALRTAQTRRLTQAGPNRSASTNDTANTSSSRRKQDRAPVWVWIGLGILLAVVITSVILLAAG